MSREGVGGRGRGGKPRRSRKGGCILLRYVRRAPSVVFWSREQGRGFPFSVSPCLEMSAVRKSKCIARITEEGAFVVCSRRSIYSIHAIYCGLRRCASQMGTGGRCDEVQSKTAGEMGGGGSFLPASLPASLLHYQTEGTVFVDAALGPFTLLCLRCCPVLSLALPFSLAFCILRLALLGLVWIVARYGLVLMSPASERKPLRILPPVPGALASYSGKGEGKCDWTLDIWKGVTLEKVGKFGQRAREGGV